MQEQLQDNDKRLKELEQNEALKSVALAFNAQIFPTLRPNKI